MGIIVKNVLIKAYHSIKLVGRYQKPLCQVYNIITITIPGTKLKLALQMFFKEFNDLIRHSSLVLTFLVFGAYFCMNDIDALLSTIN